MNRRTVLAALAAITATPAPAQSARKLPPRDESAREPALKRVVDELRAACREKSFERLRALLADEVKASFGGDDTPDSFITEWRKKPALWEELDTALKLGGTFFGRSTFAAPYVYGTFPESLDGTRYLVVLGANAPLHEQPRDTAIVAQRLTHDIVRREAPERGTPLPHGWVRVRPATGASGYIRTSLVRSPIDYRVVIEKRGERWLVTAFVAGD